MTSVIPRGPRIAFLTPEFPGQTHSFIWRERSFLREAGLEVPIVSTRPPPAAIVCQDWAPSAQAQTTYLLSMGPGDLLRAALEVLRAGPRRLLSVLRLILDARGVTLKHRARLLANVVVAARLVSLSRRQGWSHVHVHSCAEAAHIALLASRLSDITYSLAFLGPRLSVYGPNQATKWKNARFATVMSQAMLDEVRAKLAGSLPEIVEIAPLGVDTTFFERQRPLEPWQPGDPCLIYSCGRLNPVKGHTYLIEAVIEVRRRGVNARLAIAGEDEQGGHGYRAEIERFIRDREAGGFVELLGAVSAEQSRAWMERAQVFALASLDEGVSVAVMEAMSMGVPTVCTRVGGMHELVDGGVDGIMVEARQPEPLAVAILELLSLPERAAALGRMGRQKVLSRFDHRLGARTLVSLLARTGVIQAPITQREPHLEEPSRTGTP